jgi:hypothetical protein
MARPMRSTSGSSVGRSKSEREGCYPQDYLRYRCDEDE